MSSVDTSALRGACERAFNIAAALPAQGSTPIATVRARTRDGANTAKGHHHHGAHGHASLC